MSVEITGIEGVVAKLKLISNEILLQERNAMQSIVSDLQGEAQRRAPVDTGDLRGSAASSDYKGDKPPYSEVKNEGSQIIGEVGFNEPYALEQHENLTFSHPKGGQAKYLEGPLTENAQQYKQKLIEAVKQGL
jgi:hypothetical protein